MNEDRGEAGHTLGEPAGDLSAPKAPGTDERAGGKLSGALSSVKTFFQRRLAWLLAALALALIAAAASILVLSEDGGSDRDSCPPNYKMLQKRGGDGGTVKEPVRLVALGLNAEPEADPRISFPFGPSRGALLREQAFRIPGSAKRSAQGFGPIGAMRETTTGDLLPRKALLGRMTPVGIAGRVSTLQLCVDPTPPGAASAGPGTYQGVLKVGAHAAKPEELTSLPVEVTVSDTRRLIAMFAVFIGVAAGLAVRTAADLRRDGTTGRPDVADYVFSFSFLFMVAAGMLAGALVYGPLFADQPAATIDLYDGLLPLAAAAFTATLAAKSLTDLPGPSGNER